MASLLDLAGMQLVSEDPTIVEGVYISSVLAELTGVEVGDRIAVGLYGGGYVDARVKGVVETGEVFVGGPFSFQVPVLSGLSPDAIFLEPGLVDIDGMEFVGWLEILLRVSLDYLSLTGNSLARVVGISIDVSPLFYSLDVLVATLVLGGVFVLLAYRRVYGQIVRMGPLEASRVYLRGEERVEWRPSTTVTILFILSCIKIVEWASGFTFTPEIIGMGLLGIVLLIYAMISGFMEIIAPVVFPYFVINYVLHRTSLVARLTRSLSSIVSGPVGSVSYRYSMRLPGMIPRTAFLVALILFLMMYYMVFIGRSVAFINDMSSSSVYEYEYTLYMRVMNSTSIGELGDRLTELLNSSLSKPAVLPNG